MMKIEYEDKCDEDLKKMNYFFQVVFFPIKYLFKGYEDKGPNEKKIYKEPLK